MTKKYNIYKSITSCLKDKDVLLDYKLLLCLDIDKNDSGGESETEGDMLNWKLCTSDEMRDNEETEQFNNTQPIVHVGDYKLLILMLKPFLLHVLMMILVWELLKVRTHTGQQEMSQNGNLWNLAKKKQERCATQNVLPKQSGLSCFAL